VVNIACPECRATDRLRGQQHDGVICITCGGCGHRWPRDRDICPGCGAKTIADRREPLLQKARGTQQSIIGYRIVYECWSCGYRSGAPGARSAT
jgi:Zn ribbon nucleic-acid-binding protein